ncbi:MAG: hypothetical protein AAFR44_02005 [Pseudomonadota bacterium]
MRFRKIALIIGGVAGVMVGVPTALVMGAIVGSVFTKHSLSGQEARARVETVFQVGLPTQAQAVQLIENPLPEWRSALVFAAPAETVEAWLASGVLCFPDALTEGLSGVPDPDADWRTIAEAGPVAAGHCPALGAENGVAYRMMVEKNDTAPWRVFMVASNS